MYLILGCFFWVASQYSQAVSIGISYPPRVTSSFKAASRNPPKAVLKETQATTTFRWFNHGECRQKWLITLWQTNIAGWNISIFDRKDIIKGSIFYCYVSLPKMMGPCKRYLRLQNMAFLDIHASFRGRRFLTGLW